MQNASLTYNFPEKILRKYSIPALRVMASVDNVFVITKWKYYDPETMSRVPRIYTLGVYVTL